MAKTRKDMIAETRAKLIEAGRRAFATQGYAEASMDDFTAKAGLTRGALYHHFGGKPGLFEAVAMQIDDEITERLDVIGKEAGSARDALVESCVAYVRMALEPEVQRILLRDGPAVMGDPSSWPNASACIAFMTRQVEACRDAGVLRDVDPEAVARLLNGATRDAAQWIANAKDPESVSTKAVAALRALMDGVLQTAAEGY
jgi:AcrR family transcriptional regulator